MKSRTILMTVTILIFALNSCGTNSNLFEDPRDGNIYLTVEIGKQTWMGRNLAYLPTVNRPTDSGQTLYYVYDYQGTDVDEAKTTDNYKKYGVLYSWLAARTACPSGWHLPSNDEWNVLSDYLITNGYGYQGSGDDIAKSLAAKTNWEISGTPGTPGNDTLSNNRSYFSAIPGGLKRGKFFFNIGTSGNWWSSKEFDEFNAISRIIYHEESYLIRDHAGVFDGLSVRCLKDN